MIGGALASPLIRWYCAPRANAFFRALGDVKAAQRSTLARIVEGSAATDYGRSIGLAADDDADAFRSRVPLVSYADVDPWIQRQRNESRPALAPGRTRTYEPTSGSSSAAKSIPYNDALLRSFRSLFAIWAHDLLTSTLKLSSGRTFMSVSPQFGPREGTTDDRDYLSGPLRALVSPFLVLPHGLKDKQDPDQFRDALACALVNCGDLEIVSIWNPSYLLILLEHFAAHRERLLPFLSPERRKILARNLVRWQEVWPGLQLISCWTAAAAAAPARRLGALFPHALLQGKGLLATEAPVTVPLTAAGGAVPLIDEVFIELEDDAGGLRLLHEAEQGHLYEVVLTQAGGLLRYRLGDRVEVTGWHRSAPLLEFVGRADAVADLVGEKLNEAFVEQVLREVAPAQAYCTLVPVLPAKGRPYYCLLTDAPSPAFARDLDTALSGAFRYREARMLKQLDAAQVIAHPQMRRTVHDALIQNGTKAGDIKDRALITGLDLARRVHDFVTVDQRVAV